MNDKYLSPYLTGLGIGLVLLATFFIMGRGLGATGGMMRIVVAMENAVSESHVNNTPYLAKYGGGGKRPLKDWLVFEVAGVLVGGFISGALAGRIRKETNRGPKITDRQRWLYALLGGVLFGFGARLARGCSSGHDLTGGATLALGSWIVMLCMFAGAYATAYFVRKLWI
jgi:uncharacterized membrane protein YedE/YeeE